MGHIQVTLWKKPTSYTMPIWLKWLLSLASLKCHSVEDIKDPHYGSYVSNPMSYIFNNKIYWCQGFSQDFETIYFFLSWINKNIMSLYLIISYVALLVSNGDWKPPRMPDTSIFYCIFLYIKKTHFIYYANLIKMTSLTCFPEMSQCGRYKGSTLRVIWWEHTLQINNQLIKHNIATILISIPHKL
jgi:hypothetical protein